MTITDERIYYTNSYKHHWIIEQTPLPGTMAEWYENEWIDSRKYRQLGLKFDLRAWPLADWFSVAQMFGAFYPQWVA